MKNLTSVQKTALGFLQDPNRLTAVIASSYEDVPHAATVYYHVERDFTFYFLTAADTTKHYNLTQNPQTAIVIGTGPEETTLQGQGRSELLERGSEEEAVAMMQIKKRLDDHDGTWPIFQLDNFESRSIAVFKFVPETLRLLNLETGTQLPDTTDGIVDVISVIE